MSTIEKVKVLTLPRVASKSFESSKLYWLHLPFSPHFYLSTVLNHFLGNFINFNSGVLPGNHACYSAARIAFYFLKNALNKIVLHVMVPQLTFFLCCSK
jgi:hypothetical protein